jgi:predicted DNA-binding transcriptional regulator AlpA
MALGEFPKRVSLGVRAVGWVSAEIDGYIADMIKRSRKSKA